MWCDKFIERKVVQLNIKEEATEWTQLVRFLDFLNYHVLLLMVGNNFVFLKLNFSPCQSFENYLISNIEHL